MSDPPSPLIENYLREEGLLVDGFVLTGSVQSDDSGVICYYLLGAISDNIYRGRIKMGWLRDKFLERANDLNEVERIRYARTYILGLLEVI
ncbi:hypothetical protein Gohar_013792 [Gossypium harknessii]|uniref:Uncharacterized protein n=1 Tax=Gossypium harknessii TaxID=34285 RepID=A0A7J9H179_9ROSI|nr:hypothetical protein [Gossypium harknessii]